MYGPASTEAGLPLDLRRELAAVRMEYIGERVGVMLQRALERRFESAAGGERPPAKYGLQLNIVFGSEILGYRRDGAISRVRYTATTNWVLLRRAPPAEELGRGMNRTIDAFNVPDFQFFSAEISSEAMQRRLLDELVDQIFLGVAAKLRERLREGSAA
jgi:LPS-assembly lipoprotein